MKRLERAVRTVLKNIIKVDRQLLRYVGLSTDPQAAKAVDQLLDERLRLMTERDQGYRVTDRRRVTGLT